MSEFPGTTCPCLFESQCTDMAHTKTRKCKTNQHQKLSFTGKYLFGKSPVTCINNKQLDKEFTIATVPE